MKRAIKKLMAVALAATVAVGAFAMTACGNDDNGGSGVAGTYTITFEKGSMSGEIKHTGYVGASAFGINTLVLKEDMTYEYTKYVSTDPAKDPNGGVSTSGIIVSAEGEEADANVLFSWSVDKGTCTLDFYKDGTYKFHFPMMSLTENGTWEWKSWKMKLTQSNNNVVEIPMDATTREFKFEYVAVASAQLKQEFKCASSVWGVALGQTGSYTPVAGGQTPPTPEEPPAQTYSGYLYVSYKFTGPYTYDGTTVTLDSAVHCTWSEDWGQWQNHGFTSCSGTENDMVYSKGSSGRSFHPLNHFSGEYWIAPNNDAYKDPDTGRVNPADVVLTNNFAVKVKVNKTNGTFTYVEESSFD